MHTNKISNKFSHTIESVILYEKKYMYSQIKFIQVFPFAELPRPNLGDLSDLRATSIKMRRQKSPNVLGYSYHELCKLDTIKVELVPEKKGLILKHVEYEVTSQVNF